VIGYLTFDVLLSWPGVGDWISGDGESGTMGGIGGRAEISKRGGRDKDKISESGREGVPDGSGVIEEG
jgi:hypothetical protein